jgi:hypothetical protein
MWVDWASPADIMVGCCEVFWWQLVHVWCFV